MLFMASCSHHLGSVCTVRRPFEPHVQADGFHRRAIPPSKLTVPPSSPTRPTVNWLRSPSGSLVSHSHTDDLLGHFDSGGAATPGQGPTFGTRVRHPRSPYCNSKGSQQQTGQARVLVLSCAHAVPTASYRSGLLAQRDTLMALIWVAEYWQRSRLQKLKSVWLTSSVFSTRLR